MNCHRRTTERFILERYNKVNIHLFYLPIWIQNRNSNLSCFCCCFQRDILFSVWQYCGLTNYNKLTSDSLIKVKSMSAAMMHHRLHPSIPQSWKCLIFRSLTFIFYYHAFCRTVTEWGLLKTPLLNLPEQNRSALHPRPQQPVGFETKWPLTSLLSAVRSCYITSLEGLEDFYRQTVVQGTDMEMNHLTPSSPATAACFRFNPIWDFCWVKCTKEK